MQKAIGRDLTRRIHPFTPKGKPQMRKWWYPVIAHHRSVEEIADQYGRKFPTWLLAEIQKLGALEWLKFYSRSSGRRYSGGEKANPDIPDNSGQNTKSKTTKKLRAKLDKLREASPNPQSPDLVAKRLGGRMQGVEVLVRVKGGMLIAKAGDAQD